MTRPPTYEFEQAGGPHPRKRRAPDATMDLGKLDVIVVSCRGLRAADRLSGKSDPYVVINFGDKMEQTEVVKKDLNPVFKARE